jgi:pimeloyl-ACP methyl ester carboxylesterase
MRPKVVLVHGSATDRSTWSIQLRSAPLLAQFDMVAPDRNFSRTTVEQHAEDLAAIVGQTPAILVGSSFGAVVSLELARTRPDLVRGAVLIEPPMPPSDDSTLASAQRAFNDEFERRLATDGGEAAGEFFLTTVLGPEAFSRIPPAFRERSRARWAEIRADSVALVAYKPRYPELRTCEVPMLLLGGERSAPLFMPTLEALAAVLPDAELVTIPHAGHMLHAEAPRRFADLLIRFANEVITPGDGSGAT